ncbi:MAG: Penicillin-binding protein 1A [Alphaproteobacteria bacterium MarineAlpha11_Bin1]|nr:MAG: Penicillin-binding protein 1A [Alphaproteobacteria bacterium MarineAlpha11_Bin1]
MTDGKRKIPRQTQKTDRKVADRIPNRGTGGRGSALSVQNTKAVAKSPGGRWIAVRLFKWSLVCSIWGCLALAILVAWYAWDLPDIGNLSAPTRSVSITITDSGGRDIATYGDLYGEPLRLADVPPYLVQAIIATEDRRFFSHSGFDPVALVRALVVNLRAGRVQQGGSTLTQQLAKNIFLKPDRTLRRKVQELLLAFWLEANFSKEQIFTLYINRVYLGAGTYGVDAAARRYFSISARSVSLHQAAVIAGLLKAPSRYSPLRSVKAAEDRANVVLRMMVRSGFLDKKTAQEVGTRRLTVVSHSGRRRTARYFSDWALERVNSFIGRAENDLIVHTTMDARSQKIAQSRLEAVLKRQGKKRNISQAALVSMSQSGAVRALVGGRDYSSSQYNRASQSRRQPGSAFKVFVYLAAIESGMSPQDTLIDGPLKIGKWNPRNYGGGYEGVVTIKDALLRSINTVAIKISEKVGRQKVINMARRLGITSPLKSHPSLALGASEVSLLELTAAYGVIANGGIAVWPHAITEIRTRSGEVLYRRMDGAAAQVLDPNTARGVNDMLQAVVSEGTGRAAKPGRPAAGKTGTSQDFRDAWFVGYTNELVTGVWMGNDDNSPMKRVTGGGYPAELWSSYTRAALRGLPIKPLMSSARLAPTLSGSRSSILKWLERNVQAHEEAPISAD